ncbi:type II secretion system F family protein [Candidatus Laterigemmans baculatus]|uniref:type II secretion system F family protein n=1 Tax=Candidatus Laterigemmans baculatus TaxID=2770505 RepID=UPI0013DBD3B3|nr:type II secretion system F family protein [Candidatus Laterigemmans baculatus]
MLLVIISGAVAVAALFGYLAVVLLPGGDSTAAEERLDALAGVRRGGPVEEQQSLLVGRGLDETKNWMEEALGSVPGLSAYLEQANVKLTASQFIGICGGFFAAGMLVIVVTPVPNLLAPFGGLMLTGVPISWLAMKRRKRLARFGKQIPEALELLARSLRSGHSLAAGFGLIASEMDEPISREFGRVFEEQNLGIPLEEALEDLADRIPNMDLRFFATALILQRQTGGDLAEILDKISRLVRERLQIMGQVQALTGEGRLSGVVLLALPPVLFLTMFFLNRDYIMMLFTEPLGRQMLVFALVTQVVGALAIKKIITIKV